MVIKMVVKQKVLFLFISLLFAGLTVAGCGPKAAVTTQPETVVPVETATVTQGSLTNTAVATGKLEALDSSNVAPGGAGGKVDSVNVKVGDQVVKGQTLVTLENATLAASVQQAEQGVAQAKEGVVQAEQGVAQAQSNLALSKVNFEQAQANYQRGKDLYDGGAIPQAGATGFETAYQLPYDQAKIDYEDVKPAALGSAQAALGAAQAAVGTAQAGLASAQANYDHAFIKSPINGVITAVNINPGELASPSSPTPIVTVVNLDKVVVQATVTELQINTLKQGQQVPVLVSAVSAKTMTGVITDISPAADATSKAYPIKVQLDNPGHLLKPGMFAELRLSQSQPETLLAPKEAVVQIGGADNVWVVADGKATSQAVTTGDSDDKNIQILNGLQAGDQVVTAGQNMLQENVKVEIKKPAATTTGGANSDGTKSTATTSAGASAGGAATSGAKSGETN